VRRTIYRLFPLPQLLLIVELVSYYSFMSDSYSIRVLSGSVSASVSVDARAISREAMSLNGCR
jgi:hypothetical protein